MTRSEDELADEADEAAVFDFLEDLAADRERGEERPLAAYLARFPGREAAVAEEYLRQCGRLEAASPTAESSRSAGEIGPYRLVHALGHGGQGVVHLAEDTRLGRQVALKRLATPFVTESKRARFRREAESVARLAHPNIAAVLDADLEGDEPYLAMQFVPGRDLATLIAERADEPCPMRPRDRVALNRLLALFESAALALHAAHDAGLVHRDVKPANLMVTPEGEPVLLDFGLARIADGSDAPDAAPLTAEGDVFGTPQYMSPEQLEGQRDLDLRTDVYSLGVSLFEALTGERPFDGADLLRLHRAVRYAPLPVERLRVGGRDLRAVLRVATEKERSSRYASARAFAEDLRRLRESEPVLARPVGPLQRLARWTRREPALAGAIGATILALAAGLVVSLGLLRQTREALTEVYGLGLAARAERYLETDPPTALALGLEAIARADETRTRSLLLTVLEQSQLEGHLEIPDVFRSFGTVALTDGRTLGVFSAPGAGGLPGDSVLCTWDREENELRSVVRFHDDPVAAWVFDSGQDVAYIATERGVVFAFDLAAGAERWRARLPPEAGACVALARHGARLAVAAHDGTVRVLETGRGLVARELSAPPGTVGALTFSRDGSKLLGSVRHTVLPKWSGATFVTVWEVASGTRRFLETGSDVYWASWGADDATVWIAGTAEDAGATNETEEEAEPDPGQLQRHPLDASLPVEVEFFDAAVRCVSVEPRSGRVALALRDGAIVMLDGGERWTLPGPHEKEPTFVCWSPDGTKIGSVGYDNTTRVWDAGGRRLITLGRAMILPLAGEFEPDGRVFTTHGLGSRVLRWRIGLPDHVYRMPTDHGVVHHARFLGDGSRALTVGADGTYQVWSTPRDGLGPAALHRQATGLGDVTTLEVSSDGRVLLAADGVSARRFDLETRTPGAPIPYDGALALAPDGRTWAAVLEGVVHVARGSGALAPLPNAAREELVPRLAFAPDGERLVVAGSSVRLVELAAGSSGTVTPARASVLDVAWKPDGSRFAVLTADELLQVYDGRDGEPLGEPERFAHRRLTWTSTARIGWDERTGGRLALHRASGEVLRPSELPRSQVSAVAEHAAGWLAVATENGAVSIYSSRSGELILRHGAHAKAVLDVRFGPSEDDGRFLTASADGTAAIWLVDPRAAALDRRVRALTTPEWEREWRAATGRDL